MKLTNNINQKAENSKNFIFLMFNEMVSVKHLSCLSPSFLGAPIGRQQLKFAGDRVFYL